MPLIRLKRREPTIIMRADRAREAGQWQLAAGLYRIALDRTPNKPPIWIQYGHALKESGKHAEAETAYRTAIAFAPDDADAHLQLGHALKLQGKTVEAQASYLRAVALDRSLADALGDLASAGEHFPSIGGHPAPGTPAASARLNGLPGAPWRRQKESIITRADRARDGRHWPLAVHLYRKALDRNPRNAAIWVQYGHALKESGQLNEAVAAYQCALSYQRTADTYIQLGHALKMQGNINEAQAAYLRSLLVDSSSLSEALSQLAGLGWSPVQLAELHAFTSSPDRDEFSPFKNRDRDEDALALLQNAADEKLSLSDTARLQTLATDVDLPHPDRWRLTETAPEVSVLIPVHNKVELTRSCLNSIFRHDQPDIAFEIIVVDDCSTDGTASYLESLGDRIRVVRNEVRGCFGHNVNKAAMLARSAYLVILNNDTEVTPFWLHHMLDAARQDPAIGVVGNRQLYPSTGKINHAGMIFDGHYRPVHLYPDKPADFPPANISRDFQAVTGACMLVPSAVFREIGGFDPEFRNGHEDVDFCLRVRQRGYRVRYVAESVIYHHIGSSSGRYDSESENERHFVAKWDGKIVSDLHDYAVRDAAWLPAAVSAPGLMTDSADLHLAIPLQFGNAFSWVTSQLALACEEAGMRVSLLPGPMHASIGSRAQRRLQRMMERSASNRVQVKWGHFWAPYAEQEISGEIRAEIFVTNYRYGSQPVHQLDQWMRHIVSNGNRKLPVSEYCLDALTELGVAADRSRIVPHGYSPEVLHEIGVDDRFRRNGFVFLALTNSHDPYRYGTDILLSAFARAFPGREDVVLVLKDYGGQEQGVIADWVRQTTQLPKVVHLCEFISKEALLALYRGADAFVAPFRGEGFAMKVLDAAAMGLPVLAPHYGGPADYLNRDEFFPLAFHEVPVGECFDRGETIVPAFARWAEVEVDALAEQMQAVHGQSGAARRRASHARDRVLAEFSWNRVATRLIAALGDFERQRESTISKRHFLRQSDAGISVIIPTLNRPAELQKTLEAYEDQTLPKNQWELILSDDGSNYDVAGHVAPFAERFKLQVITNPAQTGAGEARNRAIPHARGDLVLFGGDDIVPRSDFLAAHVAVHREHDDPRIAVLGYTDWHSDVRVSRFMEYITGNGGQQFAYKRLQPHTFVPYGYFYTSNVSVSRRLLDRQEDLFNQQFTGAGFEDVELGLRLAQDGMQLFYNPEIVAMHLHPMPDEAIIRRQYNIGRWLVIYALLHPQRIGERHKQILRWLDTFQHVLAHNPAFVAISSDIKAAAAGIASWLEGSARATAALEAIAPLRLQPAWAAQLVANETTHLEALERLYGLRLDFAELDGIADEWFGVPAEAPNPARNLIRAVFSRPSAMANH